MLRESAIGRKPVRGTVKNSVTAEANEDWCAKSWQRAHESAGVVKYSAKALSIYRGLPGVGERDKKSRMGDLAATIIRLLAKLSCAVSPYSYPSPVWHSLSVGVQDLVHGVRHKREAHVVQVLKQVG